MTTAALQSPVKILVVDDTPICREMIAEILRREGFEVYCAGDGEDALRVLESQPFKLLLLDILMPKLDGLAVLSVVRRNEKWKELPVILLTDAADKDKVMMAAGLGASGYLLKSRFTSADLIERVRKLCSTPTGGRSDVASVKDNGSNSSASAGSKSLDQTSPAPPAAVSIGNAGTLDAQTMEKNKAKVLRAVRKELDLRPVPPVLQLVITQTHSRTSTIHEVVKTLRQDQALSLRVMRVANSSFYAAEKRAQTLDESAARIGMSGIRNALATVVAMDQFSCAQDTGMTPQRFWEHSLATASIAQTIATHLEVDNAEDLFLAGLLHDLGRMLLAKLFPEQLKQLLAQAAINGADLVAGELQAFGLTHADATQEMLKHLGVMERITAAASQHESSASELAQGRGDRRGNLIVAVADRIAHAIVAGHSGNPLLLPVHEYLSTLGLEAAIAGEAGRTAVQQLQDQELLYSFRGDAQFLKPLATELASGADVSPKTMVLDDQAPNDVISLFFEQIGWLTDDEPEVVVCSETAWNDREDIFRRVAGLERQWGRAISCLIVRQPDGPPRPAVESADRPTAEVQLPAPYDEIITKVTNLASARLRKKTEVRAPVH